jgi:hypothetical protein
MADFSITAANVQSTGSRTTGTAGATITQGQAIYRDPADGNKAKLGDCTSATAHLIEGLALNAASTGQPVSWVAQDDDFTTGFNSTVGTIIVLSEDGELAPSTDLTSGDYAVIVGVMKSTTKAVINIGRYNRSTAVIPA